MELLFTCRNKKYKPLGVAAMPATVKARIHINSLYLYAFKGVGYWVCLWQLTLHSLRFCDLYPVTPFHYWLAE